ncbi:hypothetical protein R1sor_016652 [Riccia sorocarpa]|uniref:Uncharacterized protein n=1 Tax=Riccia sorocarpa TaxID=122646 RepID=A0ABD3HG08_9MARC
MEEYRELYGKPETCMVRKGRARAGRGPNERALAKKLFLRGSFLVLSVLAKTAFAAKRRTRQRLGAAAPLAVPSFRGTKRGELTNKDHHDSS